MKRFNKKGYVMGGIPIVGVVWAGLALMMVTFSQLPATKTTHRINKAEEVCQGMALGYTAEYDKAGNMTASLVDVVNADAEGYMQNVPQYVVDTCKTHVEAMTKEERLALIQDK